ETMKMPEPIMEPITSMVALVRPKPLTKSRSEDESAAIGMVFTSVLKKAPCNLSADQVGREGPPVHVHRLKDFNLECAKIPLLIFRDCAPDRILRPLSPPRHRLPRGNFDA